MNAIAKEFTNNPALFIGMTAAEACAVLALMDEPAKTAGSDLVDFSRVSEYNNVEGRILARQEGSGGPVFDI